MKFFLVALLLFGGWVSVAKVKYEYEYEYGARHKFVNEEHSVQFQLSNQIDILIDERLRFSFGLATRSSDTSRYLDISDTDDWQLDLPVAKINLILPYGIDFSFGVMNSPYSGNHNKILFDTDFRFKGHHLAYSKEARSHRIDLDVSYFYKLSLSNLASLQVKYSGKALGHNVVAGWGMHSFDGDKKIIHEAFFKLKTSISVTVYGSLFLNTNSNNVGNNKSLPSITRPGFTQRSNKKFSNNDFIINNDGYFAGLDYTWNKKVVVNYVYTNIKQGHPFYEFMDSTIISGKDGVEVRSASINYKFDKYGSLGFQLVYQQDEESEIFDRSTYLSWHQKI